MKQTAVEWLANELYEKFEMRGDGILYDEILTKAKEIEKQQIIDARVNGVALGIDVESTPIDYDLHKTHEQYYTETYENKK